MEVKRLRAAATRAHLTSRTTRSGAAADTSAQDGQPMRQVARVAETLESLAATNGSWGDDDAAHQKAMDAMSAQMAAMAEQVLLLAPIKLTLCCPCDEAHHTQHTGSRLTDQAPRHTGQGAGTQGGDGGGRQTRTRGGGGGGGAAHQRSAGAQRPTHIELVHTILSFTRECLVHS